MRIKDLNDLAPIINKRTRFLVNNTSIPFMDIFYGVIKEIKSDHIIVEQQYIKSNEDYSEELITQNRKLKNGTFKLLEDK